jgi:hypothetical protein
MLRKQLARKARYPSSTCSGLGQDIDMPGQHTSGQYDVCPRRFRCTLQMVLLGALLLSTNLRSGHRGAKLITS